MRTPPSGAMQLRVSGRSDGAAAEGTLQVGVKTAASAAAASTAAAALMAAAGSGRAQRHLLRFLLRGTGVIRGRYQRGRDAKLPDGLGG